MCRRAGLVVFFVGLACLLALSSPVAAHVLPIGCSANNLGIDISVIPSVVVDGQTASYTIVVTNGGTGACDVTDADVVFTCPGADGTPTGAQTILTTAGNFPADGSGDTTFHVDCTINVNSDVTVATAQTNIGDCTDGLDDLNAGRLHQSANDLPFCLTKQLSVEVQSCVVEIDKQVSCDGGVTFVDIGFETANGDGTLGCTGANGADVVTRIVARNAGSAFLFGCVVTDVDNSQVILFGPTGSFDLAVGATSETFSHTEQCNADRAGREPDTASVSCFCTSDLNPALTTSAFDSATFTCQAPPPPCSVTIDKKVGLDSDCNGVLDAGASFQDSLSGVPSDQCVVYQICVTNTGGQALDSTGVLVNDSDLGVVDLNFGEIAPGVTVCKLLPGDATPTVCGTDNLCQCTEVPSSNTSSITSAVCEDTGDNACDQSGSVCSDTASVTCVTVQEVCRTPGFWGTHACPASGCETQGKSCAQNITQNVINSCGGTLNICGTTITNTLLGDVHSAVEAICVKPSGKLALQLARQLTATALNCCVSGGTADCNGVSIDATFDACNLLCADATDATPNDVTQSQISACINALDCFNNGGTFNSATGTCTPGTPGNNCHERSLPASDISGCTDGQGNPVVGSSGSSNECNAAIQNTVTVVDP